ncbi:MAG: hypothetical protein OJF59_001890 [Cytophagales bacterium]|jgi:hypothetical protein|nr:hypothetical protein [Bacteroidota bacterium]MBS1980788.1 hypothetical protein [Bacteroidota bacterium]WHZ08137.1 MAG: hypothetical protein OJF59_001890 [Cytophagales bacterium]
MKFLFDRLKYRRGMQLQRILLVVVTTLPFFGFAQAQKEKPAVTFEELYDEPFSINKLFVGFQPLYGELFATNVNAGFGIEAMYYYKDKFDIKASFRKTYSSEFFDFNRNASLLKQNSGVPAAAISDKPNTFSYYEIGGTYHFKDFDQESKTKMVLYRKSFKGDRWAATVPLHAEIPCKVRKIYGGRLGAILWNSTADLTRAMAKQGLTNANLKTAAGASLPSTYTDQGQNKQLYVFGNMSSAAIYLGGSMSWIRNVAVSFDKYDDGVDDGMMTVFFDIMVAPATSLDPVTYLGNQYSTKAIKTNMLGMRAGIEGKFNRTLGWSYGGEMGYRPSINGQGFYAMFKIAFPLYSTNLDYKVESFGK